MLAKYEGELNVPSFLLDREFSSVYKCETWFAFEHDDLHCRWDPFLGSPYLLDAGGLWGFLLYVRPKYFAAKQSSSSTNVTFRCHNWAWEPISRSSQILRSLRTRSKSQELHGPFVARVKMRIKQLSKICRFFVFLEFLHSLLVIQEKLSYPENDNDTSNSIKMSEIKWEPNWSRMNLLTVRLVTNMWKINGDITKIIAYELKNPRCIALSVYQKCEGSQKRLDIGVDRMREPRCEVQQTGDSRESSSEGWERDGAYTIVKDSTLQLFRDSKRVGIPTRTRPEYLLFGVLVSC